MVAVFPGMPSSVVIVVSFLVNISSITLTLSALIVRGTLANLLA